jgi:hypothetical protein
VPDHNDEFVTELTFNTLGVEDQILSSELVERTNIALTSHCKHGVSEGLGDFPRWLAVELEALFCEPFVRRRGRLPRSWKSFTGCLRS